MFRYSPAEIKRMNERFSHIRRSGVLLLALLGACNLAPPRLPAPQQIAAPDPSQVERVLFLVGDPGEARRDHYPIVPRLQQDIEWWAERLPRDSAVTVLFLGDIVYPLGLHAPGTPEYPADSAVVMDQVRLVAGRFARQRRAQGYFMAGNHDWGLKTEREGYERLKNLDAFLAAARSQTNAQVRLVPEAGTGGPYVVDIGEHIRLLILDSAWWIIGGWRSSDNAHRVMLERVQAAMKTAGNRQVIFAAHHPFQSAGPHGGEFSFWETIGLRYILARSGAVLQDLSSYPYRELKAGLRSIFNQTGPPLLFVGGHEHSLQIIEGRWPNDPKFSIVSGSASKVSGIGREKNMRFGRAAPGYMRLLVHRDGRMSIFVESAPAQFKSCPTEDPQRQECMAAGVAAFQTVHSQHIR